MTRLPFPFLLVGSFCLAVAAQPAHDAKPPTGDAIAKSPAKSPYTGGNRLAYLDEINPYYPHKDFAKLITPQWVGEEGVEAVVILSIDDMRDPARYEQYLRPILDRLKQVGNSDGLSRMSIFTNSVDPKHAQLQAWLKEGVTFEVHTITHPCPCLGTGPGLHNSTSGDIKKAKATYDGCVDLLHQIPNYKGPVAFRMPCCDSMNSVSPRFFAELMNKTTEKGHFLSIDSSVFNIFTSDDPALPRELVLEKDEREGAAPDAKRERFAKYAQFPGFVNTIENYPYPYVIGNMIWQFPCVVPSDWEAQHLHKPNNPRTVEDLKANLDCTVLKQGVFTLVFHPHGWIKAEQIVELIDHAEKKHGKKVKFLNFQDALERINQNMLKGQAIRDEKGNDNGVRVLDSDADGAMDTVAWSVNEPHARCWELRGKQWKTVRFPIKERVNSSAAAFGIVRSTGAASVVILTDDKKSGFSFVGDRWIEEPGLSNVPNKGGVPVLTQSGGADGGVRLRDVDGDGTAEMVVANSNRRGVYRWDAKATRWESLSDKVLGFASFVDKEGRDAGLRLTDLNGDGKLDAMFSIDAAVIVGVFTTFKDGWTRSDRMYAAYGALDHDRLLPPIIRADGTNNGFFVKGDALYWQNEDTGGKEPHHVKKITFKEVLALADVEPGEKPADAKPQAAGTDTYEGKNFTTAHPAPPPPRSIEESLRSIQVREGYRVELVASEPLTMDPIAFDWGPDGKLWIVEMADYPSGMDGKGKPGGRIVYLEDTNGDEKYDKRTVFLDGVPFPTGVMVWKKGVLVTAAPDIFYAEDTDNDGKADKRETLFTGFGEGNQQHRVNGLRWGLDGWIYLGNGDSGGNVKNIATGEVTNINGRDLRIRQNPDGKWTLDPQSGQTQFGRERDDFGNWFGNNNPNPGWHYALEDHYLRRNPHVAAPNPRVDLTGDRTIFPISIVHSPSIENHRITPGPPGSPATAQHSSANSLCPYRDDLYGPDFATSIFISEPVHNLVRRLVLKPKSVTFTAQRAPGEEKREFLASSDPWFRPTMLRTGPDGCLWIADMHRQTIEHPQWIPPAWQKMVNLREGDDKGRIYRVVPVNKKPRAMMKLDKLDAKGLAAALDSPNGWQRDMVQMMLVWNPPITAEQLKKFRELKADLEILDPKHEAARKARKALDEYLTSILPAVAQLRVIARGGGRAATRSHALAGLAQLEVVDDTDVVRQLIDPHPSVRRHALTVVNQWLPNKATTAASRLKPREDSLGFIDINLSDVIFADLQASVLRTQNDPDPQVRQQLTYTLGQWHDERAGKALAQILIKDANDPYIVAAAMSSVLPHLDTVLKELIGPTGAIPADQIAARAPIIEKLIGMAVASDQLGAVTSMLDVVTMPQDGKYGPWQFSALSRLLDAMARKNLTLAKLRENATRASTTGTGGNAAAGKRLTLTLDRIPQVTVVARSVAVDPKESEDLRLAAIELFSRLGGEQRLQVFIVALTDLRSPPAVQQSAAAALAKLGGSAAHQALLAGWAGYSPALRSAVIDGLLKQDDAALALLNAIEKKSPGAPGAPGAVSPHDVDVPRRQPLLNHKDETIRAKAAFVFGGLPDADRQKVIDAFAAELVKIGRGGGGGGGGASVAGDATRGRAVFEKNCAACHRLGDVGKGGIAPDLAKVADASQQGLLISILDPNRAVEAKYISYLAETKAGDLFTGILTSETGSSITIVGVDGNPRTVLRNELESLRSTGLSLMPNGLEQAIKPSDMADLFAFITSHGTPPKTFPGNEPRKITADDKGVLTLPASAAEVRGPTLIFEQQYRNLGWWSSEQDSATWTIELDNAPAPGPAPAPAAALNSAAPVAGRRYDVTLDWALANESKAHAFQLLVAGQRITGPVPTTGSWDVYKQAKVGTITLPARAGVHRVMFRSAGPVTGALIDLRTVTLTPVKE